jgi:Zn finger protein HypA/HybF involved in hydrogenase expression
MATIIAPASDPATSAPLHCRHCGGEIASDSRRVQCPHCGALFPFACLVCSRNLRTPFLVFDDERYLTFPTRDEESGARVEAKPLCAEHFLRHCPDCSRWFHAHENPGFFRCARCAEQHEASLLAPPVKERKIKATPLQEASTFSVRARQLNANMVALACAGGALLGLACWYLLNL